MPHDSVAGLSSTNVSQLQKQFGKNTIDGKDEFFALFLLVSQYKNFISLILFAATLISFFIGDTLDTLFIFIILLLNGLFGFIQEYRAHSTLQKLKELVAPLARVVRDGQEQELDARELVPGDIIVLREGDKIPADGILTTDVPVEIDESILTGESLPVEKIKQDTLFSGTFVLRGRGYLQITATGFQTRLGKIAAELKNTQKPTIPLVKNLSDLSRKLALVAGTLAAALIPISLFQGRDLTETLLVSVSVAVALIPEGLALVVTLALAVGAYRMAKRGAIVRKMAAIETLGTANIILSDKTGTLTQNKITVKKHWLKDKQNLNLLLRCCVAGNTASLVLKENHGSVGIVGDSTDGALLMFAKNNMQNFEVFSKEGRVIEEKPFNPTTKIIETTWEENGKKHEFVRGAPETIFKMVGDTALEEKELEQYAKEGLRVIAFAHRNNSSKFSLLGIVGMYDPPRAEAKQAVTEAKQAGIKIVMVTGDNPVTAKAIAEEIGMIDAGELVLTHDEIEKTTDEELISLLPKVRILARMQPIDKLRLVRLYKTLGAIVAVTGDGVNDALALSEAHVGVAMGKSGTDVAKEAADIVITDDNLYTIVKAVEEGRGVYDNIIKVVVFLLSTNLTEFFLILFALLLNLPIPLSPTQILWINLVGDGAPALALATDTKQNNVLKRKPRNANEQILNLGRIRNIFFITGMFSVILLGIYLLTLSLSYHISSLLIFNLIVVGEMVILFIIRGGLFPINKFMLGSILLTFLLQIVASTYLRNVF